MVTNTRRIKPNTAIAATYGMDVRELSEYRYQPGRNPLTMYSFEYLYVTASKTKPTYKPSEDHDWVPANDQFWAEQAGTIIWVCDTTPKKG